ncbi:MAG: hypothetical protein IKM48_07785 [Clostridia bacterium]|nr:hypothetical protein [Clostridia bacterium]
MKLFRSVLLLLGETAAFGWFILRDISFMAILPLIPLGLLFYYFHRCTAVPWLNGLTALLSAVAVAFTVSAGVFDGSGFFALALLLFAVSLMAVNVPKEELQRISGWWLAAFLAVFAAMLIATAFGLHRSNDLPTVGKWYDILAFYLLAFLEPLGMGKEYRAAPLALGIVLIPFASAAYLALGSGAFESAEYPYLSVWAGVSVSSFHHIEGIILCLYYGVGILRMAHFWQKKSEFSSANACNCKKFIV